MREFRTYKDGKGNIIVVTVYGGKSIKGVAKCMDGDEYDEAFGERLATARCKQKLYTAKLRVAKMKEEAYMEMREHLIRRVDKLIKSAMGYRNDCEEKLRQLEAELHGMLG